MPNISEATLCERIREVDKGTTIVIVSGHGSQSDIDAGLLAGANVYLVKPDTSEFVATVRRLIGGASGTPL